MLDFPGTSGILSEAGAGEPTRGVLPTTLGGGVLNELISPCMLAGGDGWCVRGT